MQKNKNKDYYFAVHPIKGVRLRELCIVKFFDRMETWDYGLRWTVFETVYSHTFVRQQKETDFSWVRFTFTDSGSYKHYLRRDLQKGRQICTCGLRAGYSNYATTCWSRYAAKRIDAKNLPERFQRYCNCPKDCFRILENIYGIN